MMPESELIQCKTKNKSPMPIDNRDDFSAEEEHLRSQIRTFMCDLNSGKNTDRLRLICLEFAKTLLQQSSNANFMTFAPELLRPLLIQILQQWLREYSDESGSNSCVPAFKSHLHIHSELLLVILQIIGSGGSNIVLRSSNKIFTMLFDLLSKIIESSYRNMESVEEDKSNSQLAETFTLRKLLRLISASLYFIGSKCPIHLKNFTLNITKPLSEISSKILQESSEPSMQNLLIIRYWLISLESVIKASCSVSGSFLSPITCLVDSLYKLLVDCNKVFLKSLKTLFSYYSSLNSTIKEEVCKTILESLTTCIGIISILNSSLPRNSHLSIDQQAEFSKLLLEIMADFSFNSSQYCLLNKCLEFTTEFIEIYGIHAISLKYVELFEIIADRLNVLLEDNNGSKTSYIFTNLINNFLLFTESLLYIILPMNDVQVVNLRDKLLTTLMAIDRKFSELSQVNSNIPCFDEIILNILSKTFGKFAHEKPSGQTKVKGANTIKNYLNIVKSMQNFYHLPTKVSKSSVKASIFQQESTFHSPSELPDIYFPSHFKLNIATLQDCYKINDNNSNEKYKETQVDNVDLQAELNMSKEQSDPLILPKISKSDDTHLRNSDEQFASQQLNPDDRKLNIKENDDDDLDEENSKLINDLINSIV
ncbi:MAG: hypothetical protein MHMPM18_002383 [Marteilia pararefringens]